MPSKFKKAIAAVKDQTSISLAKVGGAESSTLEVAILKATTHDEVPMDERHVTEVLQLVSSNKSYAGSCARAIGRRIGRTRNWVVAIKSLMMVLRIFQDGDPHFPKEVLHAMKRGYKILNLSSFRDDSSTSCPWDFTAFVRTFALYLDERLDNFLTGKLQRRTSYHRPGHARGYAGRKHEPVVRDMKPAMLLDRISHWQRLLDRAIATRPTGAAKTNRLVQSCLYAIVQETFDLYRDISDGLALLLDSFFHLQYNNCVNAFQTCVRASKQFEELCAFYDLCKSIGVGRTSEYPSIQKVSEELVETLQEFLKDQSSFPGANGRSPSPHLPLPAPLSPKEYDSCYSSARQSLGDRTLSEFDGSQCTSLEDLICADAGFSPERYSDPGEEKNVSHMEEYYSANDTASVRSDPTDHRGVNSMLDLLSLDDPSPPPPESQEQEQGQAQEQSYDFNNKESFSSASGQGWELVLFETTEPQTSIQPSNHNHDNVANNTNGFEVDLFSSLNANANADVASPSSSWLPPEQTYTNPFLQDTNGGDDDLFGSFADTSMVPGASVDFSSGGFPTDLGLGVNNTVPPNFQADFGNGYSSGGFPTDLEPTFEANFDDNNANFPADFATDLGNTNTGAAPSTFHVDFGNGNSHGGFSDFGNGNNNGGLPDFFSDLGSGHSHGGFSDGKPNVLPTFPHNSGHSNALTIPPIISNANANVSSPRLNSNSNAISIPPIISNVSANVSSPGLSSSTNALAISPIISNASANVSSPRLSSSTNALAISPVISNASANVSSLRLDHADFGSRNLTVSPSFSAGSGVGSANSMNAIVPFGQMTGDDLFSSTPTFQAMPTFRATNSELDQQSNFHFEDDPFGSLPAVEQKMRESFDQQSVSQQQQLWLQIQSKIMAKHLT